MPPSPPPTVHPIASDYCLGRITIAAAHPPNFRPPNGGPFRSEPEVDFHLQGSGPYNNVSSMQFSTHPGNFGEIPDPPFILSSDTRRALDAFLTCLWGDIITTVR